MNKKARSPEDKIKDMKSENARNMFIQKLLQKRKELHKDFFNDMQVNEIVMFYADIVKNIPIGLHIYYLEDLLDDRTLRMIATNSAASEFTGLPMERLIGRTLDENFPNLREKGIPQVYAEVVRTGRTKVLEDMYYSDQWVVKGAFSVRAFPLPPHCVGVVFENILFRKQVEEELKESEGKYATIVEKGSDGICIVQDGIMTFANAVLREMLGIPAEAENYGLITEIVSPEYRELVSGKYRKRMSGEDVPSKFELSLITREGDAIQVEINISHIEYSGKPATMGFIRDIRERKKAEEKLRETTITDDLTGLLNRRGFYTLAEQQCKLANRVGKPMHLLYLDIDGFKSINDKFGHVEGDQALVDTANILRRTFRESDIIARIGGDEFVVLLTEPAESDIESIIIEHINRNLIIHNDHDPKRYKLIFSMGVSRYDPAHPCSMSALLTMADRLMYEEKKKHKREGVIDGIRAVPRYETHTGRWVELDRLDMVKIKNISIGGICLRTSEELLPQKTYQIRGISFNRQMTTVKGKVMWSKLYKSMSPDKGSLAIYEAGIKFMELSERNKHFLGSITSDLANN